MVYTKPNKAFSCKFFEKEKMKKPYYIILLVIFFKPMILFGQEKKDSMPTIVPQSKDSIMVKKPSAPEIMPQANPDSALPEHQKSFDKKKSMFRRKKKQNLSQISQ